MIARGDDPAAVLEREVDAAVEHDLAHHIGLVVAIGRLDAEITTRAD